MTKTDPNLLKVMVFNTHYAAGAPGHNGDHSHRPDRIRALLGASWDKSWYRTRRLIRRALRHGWCVVLTVDANDPKVKWNRLHQSAMVATSHGPDYIVAFTPDGYKATRPSAVSYPGWEGAHRALGAQVRWQTPDGRRVDTAHGFFNSGRDVPAGIVEATHKRIHDNLVGEYKDMLVSVGFVEIREGDSDAYDEVTILGRVWAGWRQLLMRKRFTREPMVVSSKVDVLERAETSVVRGSSVPSNSPTRVVNFVGVGLPIT